MKKLPSNAPVNILATLLCFIIVFSSMLIPFVVSGAIYQPPMDDDELGHELLAANVARGRGFGISLDSSILQPYLEFVNHERYGGVSKFVTDGEYEKQLKNRGIGEITTFRPPAYIFSLALIYKIFGRHFVYYRLLNAFFIALGAAVLFFTLSKLGYTWFSTVATLIIASDVFLMRVTLFALTESLSYLLVSCLFSLLLFLPKQKYGWHAILLGSLSGLLILTRPVFAFCIPLVWLFILRWIFCNFGIRATVIYVLRMGVVCCLLIAPWCIRNMQLLRAPMPLGSQGSTVLGMVYSDGILERYGNWTNDVNVNFYASYEGSEEGFERERALALKGSSIFKSWIREHYDLLPKVMFLRLVSLWWVHADFNQKVLIFLSLIGLCILKDSRLRRASVYLIIAYSFAIVLTTNNENGRYLMGVYPVLHILSGIVVGRFGLWMLKVYRSRLRTPSSFE